MAVDNRIQTKTGLIDTEKPWKPHHDVNATHKAIEHMLAGGTPNWVKWPQDYKNFVKESFAAEREITLEMAEQYHLEDQENLTNRKARMVNAMTTRDFIRKLRESGIKCFTIDNGLKGTVGLWCLPPNRVQRARYICYLQIPAMYEWSVLKVDQYGKPIGEAFRGWRTVLVQLVEKEILTEEQVNKMFGVASNNPVFGRYHRSMYEARNQRRYTEDELNRNDY